MPVAVNGLKECSECHETKPVSKYHKESKHSDGLRSKCKDCIRVHSKRYYQENEEARSEYNKQYRQPEQMY